VGGVERGGGVRRGGGEEGGGGVGRVGTGGKGWMSVCGRVGEEGGEGR